MKIAYITQHPFSSSSAMALRITGIATALAEAGNEVTVLSTAGTGQPLSPDLAALIPSRMKVTGLPRQSGRVQRGVKLMTVGEASVGTALADGCFDAALSYGSTPGLLYQLHHSKIRPEAQIVDLVEWYDWSHQRLPIAIMNEATMRWRLPRFARMLTISSYLSEYYSKRGVLTLQIPPLFNPKIRTSTGKWSTQDGLLHVVLSGSIGGKELNTLRNLVAATSLANRRHRRVKLHLVGPSEAEVAKALGPLADDSAGLVFHGRVEHSAATRIVESADFLALQRPQDKRYAMAGFPSKVAESWILGTPVVTNLTSDLGLYAQDGENAIVLTNDEQTAMQCGIERAIEDRVLFDPDGISRWARQHFAPEAHATRLNKFVRSAAAM